MRRTTQHVTRLDVSEAESGFNWTSQHTGEVVRREECSLLKLDHEPVGVEVRVTIDTEGGMPGTVFINGAHPLYETFVFRDGGLVAHDPGLLVHKS